MPDGGYLVADYSRVWKVDASGRIRVFAGTGHEGDSGDGGPAQAARLTELSDVSLLPDGGVLIADRGSEKIRKVGVDGRITTVAGGGNRGLADGGPATAAELSNPSGVAADVSGRVLIADTYNQRIRRVAPDGTISTVAGSGKLGFAGDGGPATAALLTNPADVAVLPDGSYLIADHGNQVIRRVDTRGIITTVAGRPSVGGKARPGAPIVGGVIGRPNSVTATPDGGFLITSSRRGGWLGWMSPTGTLSTIAGNGPKAPFGGDGRLAHTVSLSGGAYAVTYTTDGNLLLAGFRVQLISPLAGPRLAVAIGPGTRVTGRHKKVGYVATTPAAVRISLDRRSLFSGTSRIGNNQVTLPGKLRAGRRYRLKLTATTADGQVATDFASVIPGRVVSMAVARATAQDVANNTIQIFESGVTADVGRCRRFSARRVDCRLLATPEGEPGLCEGIIAITVRSDGQTYGRRYGCRFHARPHWSARRAVPTAYD